MGIPYTPPPVYEPPGQNQNQNQNQEQQTLSELIQNQSQEADATSKAESSTVNSASQKNIQINNNSNRIEFETFKIPESTFNLSVYGSDNDVGGIATVNIPLGGKSRSKILKALDARVAAIEVENERSYLSACASIKDQGYLVVKDAEYAQRLSKCDSHIIARALPAPPPAPAPKFTNELEELREQNRLMRQQIDLLLKQNSTLPRKGGF